MQIVVVQGEGGVANEIYTGMRGINAMVIVRNEREHRGMNGMIIVRS